MGVAGVEVHVACKKPQVSNNRHTTFSNKCYFNKICVVFDEYYIRTVQTATFLQTTTSDLNLAFDHFQADVTYIYIHIHTYTYIYVNTYVHIYIYNYIYT